MNKFIKYNNKLNVIGEKIKFYREKQGLSLSQLSNKLMLLGLDIPKASLQNIESGKRVIREYEFYVFCKIFNITMEEMLEDFINNLEN